MDPPTDPLASQGAIVVDDDNEFVFVVNAGSDDTTTYGGNLQDFHFIIQNGRAGARPIGLTIHGNLVYVLSEGGPAPSITGFSFDEEGKLTPIPGSTQPLIGGATADPAQIGFNSDGTVLVVTEKMGNRLNVYPVNAMGVAGPPRATPSNGMTPFGFVFGLGDFLFVTETFGGASMMGAVSSYDGNGTMFDVITQSSRNNQTATSRIVRTNSGRHIFVSNRDSGSISSYAANERGELTLNRSVAANTGNGSAPTDIALTKDSKFLYVLENGSHVVSGWRVGTDGSLVSIGEFGPIPAGAAGIAAY
jgi:6-phosphogluconolactonase (cycloisomerase 2 family)